MIICENVLSKEDLAEIQLEDWTRGRSALGSSHKDNFEIKHNESTEFVMKKIINCDKLRKYGFIKHLTKPRFNKYAAGGKYNEHVDFFKQEGIRADWSMTLFLTDDYEGGELVIKSLEGDKQIKCRAGDMVLYPSGSIHRVNPVLKGERIAAIAWAESYIREPSERDILCKLVDLIEKDDSNVELSYVYNNLLRKWST